MAVLLALGASSGQGRYLWVFALFGVAMTAYGYWNSDKLAIRAMHARPVSEAGQPAMYRIVRELSTAAPSRCRGCTYPRPRPRTPSPPGATRSNAAVCCTEGILEILDERELRGVLGHELMHVYNRDILTRRWPPPSPASSPPSPRSLMFAGIFGGATTRTGPTRSR